MNTRNESHDVIVVGTGIAGLAAALALARQSLRVTLLGPRRELPAAPTDHYDPRVYALSPASRDLLQQLGAWPGLPVARLTTVDTMEVHGDHGGRVHLHAWQAGRADLATIVEATELERALRHALQVFGVPWLESHLESITRRTDADPIELHTEHGQTLRAGLVVAADGADSPLRHAAGLSVQRRAYGAVGLVAHLDAELPHQGVAMQWFTQDDGILALLPMPDTAQGPQVSMVWSCPSHRADTLRELPEAERRGELARQLSRLSHERLGCLEPRSALRGFDLALLHAPQRVAPGIALIGDAAHVVHPLAGQGLNLGLGDVHALAQVLAQREPYRQPGDARVLRRYQRARAESLTAMRLATDGLYHLFEAPLPPLAWLRNTGMQWVDRLPWVKRELIQRASSF